MRTSDIRFIVVILVDVFDIVIIGIVVLGIGIVVLLTEYRTSAVDRLRIRDGCG